MGSSSRSQWGGIYKQIDVPADLLFCCFYCGCVATELDHVPPLSRYHDYKSIYDRHRPLLVPSCCECNGLLGNSLQGDLNERFILCKKRLTKKWAKVIKYGEIWDEDAAEYADFSGNFESFVQQAQRMAVESKKRLDWMHWPVSVEGDLLEINEIEYIMINDKQFLSLDHIIDHARKVDKIPIKYLDSVLDIVGVKNIQFAYNLCKSKPVKNQNQLKEILLELSEDFVKDTFQES